MSVVKILDDVTEWAQENICNKIKLKVPPSDDADLLKEPCSYTLVNPTAFTLFVPTKDKLPPKVTAPIPSLCVRFLEGSDALDGSGGTINLQFALSTWDAGLQGPDIFHKNADGSYQQWSSAVDYFDRNADGWRDAWNFVDIALRELESTTSIAGYAIDRQSSVEYGPLADQEGIPDYYPFWFCWINFALKYPISRNVENVEEYL